jgi:hypothetical protein
MRRLAKRFSQAVLAITAIFGFLVLPAIITTSTPAMAQRVSVSAEFRTALEPYGEFRQHRRWGDVWMPSHVRRDWRPYTVGRWIYSNDYGWYWESDREEAEWGWVAYHYGRWVWDDDLGWIWVPGRQWGPAWVEWRHSKRHIGWAPLPPDEIIVEVRENPKFWVFVEPRNFVATRISTVVVAPEPAIFREAVVVNETVIVRERDLAVNPGIAPAFIAAAAGRPIRAFDVQPRILAGTANISGASIVRTEDLRRADFRRTITRETNIRQSSTVIQPAKNVPPPQPLAPNERGRLGENPPRAAAGATTGVAPQQPQRRPQQDTTGAVPERGPQGRTGVAPERGPQPGLRERGGPERGTTGAAPERPTAPQPGLREQRGPQPGLRERGGPERGTTGAAPERPTAPQPGLREQRGPQPGLRERGGPERGPQPGSRERGGL